MELCVPTPEACDWIDRNISLLDLRDVQGPQRWPGANLRRAAWSDPGVMPAARVGQLWWPAGAGRFAVGRFLATGGQLSRIKALAFTGSLANALPLVLQAEAAGAGITGKVTASMFLLPPRPLAGFQVALGQTGQEKDLYLLTLVDVRYYWQFAPVSLPGGTLAAPLPWSDAYAACATALNVTLTPGTISTDYGNVEPDSALYINSESAALVLDALLANTGRCLAAKFDGTFTIQKYADARDAAKAQRLLYVPTAGGQAGSLDSAAASDFRKNVLPSTLAVTFPQWVDGAGYAHPTPTYRAWGLDSYHSVYTKNVDVTALTGYSQYVASNAGTRVLHDTAKARYAADPPSGSPTNSTDLTNLTERLAKDYCDAHLGLLDEVWPGILPWAPDGLNDLLFAHRTDACCTRVQGRPWDVWPAEFSHGLGPLADPRCVKVMTNYSCVSGVETKTFTYLRGVDASSTACP